MTDIRTLNIASPPKLEVGDHILCANGHYRAKVLRVPDAKTIHYGSCFGDWQQDDPAGRPFPIRCNKCEANVFVNEL